MLPIKTPNNLAAFANALEATADCLLERLNKRTRRVAFNQLLESYERLTTKERNLVLRQFEKAGA